MALSDIVREIQNPVLGATLLWRYAVGYADSSRANEGSPLQLTFLVLPLLLHEETAKHIKSTLKSSGLRKFTEKFGTTANRQSDILLGLHNRAKALRELSLESLQIAHASRLIRIDLESGSVFSSFTDKIKPAPPKPIQEMVTNAEKIGVWLGELSIPEIATTLKVRF